MGPTIYIKLSNNKCMKSPYYWTCIMDPKTKSPDYALVTTKAEPPIFLKNHFKEKKDFEFRE